VLSRGLNPASEDEVRGTLSKVMSFVKRLEYGGDASYTNRQIDLINLSPEETDH